MANTAPINEPVWAFAKPVRPVVAINAIVPSHQYPRRVTCTMGGWSIASTSKPAPRVSDSKYAVGV